MSPVGFTFHIQHHTDPATERKLDWIINALQYLIEGHQRMALDFSKLQAEISEIGADVAAIAQLVRTTDPADQATINELADKLDAHGKALEALITPPDPAPAA